MAVNVRPSCIRVGDRGCEMSGSPFQKPHPENRNKEVSAKYVSNSIIIKLLCTVLY
jgi:hypothetical protein